MTAFNLLRAGLVASLSLGVVAMAEIRITEYMYSGANGEFIELTNVGAAPVDLSGWSYDDSNAVPGTFAIGAIGILAPGQSALITDSGEAAFRAAWGIAPSVPIVADLGIPTGNNIGRNDAINLYDADGVLVDQLIYGDQSFPGSIRTQGVAGWAVAAGLGANDPYAWGFAVVADSQGSVTAGTGEIGSPGAFVVVGTPTAGLGMVVSEYMYDGPGGEFIEFTNLSDAPIDMAGWTFDDNNFGAGETAPFDVSGFGIVQPGESVVLTEQDPEVFRANWGLGASVRIVGNLGLEYGNGLGRNDTIHIYDAAGELVDQLAFGDQDFPGTIRTQNISGWTDLDGLGANDPFAWVLSVVADSQGSLQSTGGDIGNPGSYVLPTPTTPGDLNGDGVVDGADLGILLSAWGACNGCPADLNLDGVVDGADLGALLASWS